MYNIYVHMYIRICSTFYLQNDTFGDRYTSNNCWFKRGRFAASRNIPTPVRKLIGETAGCGAVDCGSLLREDARIDVSDTYPVNCVLQICTAIPLPSYATTRHQVCFITYVYYCNKIKYSFGFFFYFSLDRTLTVTYRYFVLFASELDFIYDRYFFLMYLILVLCIYIKLFVIFCTGWHERNINSKYGRNMQRNIERHIDEI